MTKILFLTSRLPYPLIGGDRLKNYFLLKILSKYFKIHLLSIVEEQSIDDDFYKCVEELGITYKIFKKNKIAFYSNLIKALFNHQFLQVNYYYFATLIRTGEYIIDKNKPKILDMADSIALNYMRSKNLTKSIKWKLIYFLEINRLFQYERKCILKFDKTLFFNRDKIDFFKMPNKTFLIHHGVNEHLLGI